MIKVRYEVVMYGTYEELELNLTALRDAIEPMSLRQCEELIVTEVVEDDA